MISLDIETYGACRKHKGRELPKQTVFHPMRSIQQDKPHRLILTVQATVCEGDTWCSLMPGTTAIYYPERSADRRLLGEVLRWADTVLAHNAQFDVSYLRTIKELAGLLNERTHRLVDTTIMASLLNEGLPSRKLKDLGPLLGLYRYEREIGEERFESVKDKEFLAYAAADPHNTALLAGALANLIREQYPDTDKMSDLCLDHYSDLLWTCIHMSESGIQMDRRRLGRLHEALLRRVERRVGEFRDTYRVVLAGKGSQKTQQALMTYLCSGEFDEQAWEKVPDLDAPSRWPPVRPEGGWPLEDPQVQRTGKTKQISFNEHNLLLLYDAYHGSEWGRVIKDILNYKRMQKILSSYTFPLLQGRRKDIEKGAERPDRKSILLEERAYPLWFPVASSAHDQSDTEGGTEQARLAAKQPSVPTFPPVIQRCRSSRYRWLVKMDLSQIELRTAGLLSGEPSILDAYLKGLDLHTLRAISVLEAGEIGACTRLFGTPTPDKNTPGFNLYRQGGKGGNFADLFWSSDKTMQQQMYDNTGQLLPLRFFTTMVENRERDRPVLFGWQNDLIKKVRQTDHLEIPLIGLSRHFTAGHKNYLNRIINFPVQATAALVLQAIQAHVRPKLPRNTVLTDQCYDAFTLETDMPNECTALIRRAVWYVENRGLWARWQEYYGRECPLVADIDPPKEVKKGKSE